jgi:hypothetical protein
VASIAESRICSWQQLNVLARVHTITNHMSPVSLGLLFTPRVGNGFCILKSKTKQQRILNRPYTTRKD